MSLVKIKRLLPLLLLLLLLPLLMLPLLLLLLLPLLLLLLLLSLLLLLLLLPLLLSLLLSLLPVHVLELLVEGRSLCESHKTKHMRTHRDIFGGRVGRGVVVLLREIGVGELEG